MEYSLWEKGYQTLLCISDNDPNRETLHFANLLNRRVDGVLMIYCSEESAIDALMQTVNVPVVFADRLVTGHPSVAGDGFIGGQLAAQHLLELGHRRIGVLAGDAMIKNVGQRVAGFRQDFEAGGGQLVMVLEGHQSLDLGLRVEDVLGNQKRADRVTAVFATNDIVAIGAWRRLLELGYKIPEDISLIGFDDISMSRLLVPPLTTVAQNLSQVAREAAALLIELIGHRRSNRLNGASGESVNRLIAPTLIVRGSTGGVSVSGL
jgi:LacI family transcriptional regulator